MQWPGCFPTSPEKVDKSMLVRNELSPLGGPGLRRRSRIRSCARRRIRGYDRMGGGACRSPVIANHPKRSEP